MFYSQHYIKLHFVNDDVVCHLLVFVCENAIIIIKLLFQQPLFYQIFVTEGFHLYDMNHWFVKLYVMNWTSNEVHIPVSMLEMIST